MLFETDWDMGLKAGIVWGMGGGKFFDIDIEFMGLSM